MYYVRRKYNCGPCKIFTSDFHHASQPSAINPANLFALNRQLPGSGWAQHNSPWLSPFSSPQCLIHRSDEMNVAFISGIPSYLSDVTRARPGQCCYLANRPTGPAPDAMTVVRLQPRCDDLHRDIPDPASPHPPLLFQSLAPQQCERNLRPSQSCPPPPPSFLPRQLYLCRASRMPKVRASVAVLSSNPQPLPFRPITTTEGASSPCCARGSWCCAPSEVRTAVPLASVCSLLSF